MQIRFRDSARKWDRPPRTTPRQMSIFDVADAWKEGVPPAERYNLLRAAVNELSILFGPYTKTLESRTCTYFEERQSRAEGRPYTNTTYEAFWIFEILFSKFGVFDTLCRSFSKTALTKYTYYYKLKKSHAALETESNKYFLLNTSYGFQILKRTELIVCARVALTQGKFYDFCAYDWISLENVLYARCTARRLKIRVDRFRVWQHANCTITTSPPLSVRARNGLPKARGHWKKKKKRKSRRSWRTFRVLFFNFRRKRLRAATCHDEPLEKTEFLTRRPFPARRRRFKYSQRCRFSDSEFTRRRRALHNNNNNILINNCIICVYALYVCVWHFIRRWSLRDAHATNPEGLTSPPKLAQQN